MPKRKRRKIKFKPVHFKLTSLQKAKVDAFCKQNSTSAITMYKKAIFLYLEHEGYGNYKPVNTVQEHANQMSIFDFID
ncbi:hypothetical protein MASR1M74_23540 [Lentimicrobium sp.]